MQGLLLATGDDDDSPRGALDLKNYYIGTGMPSQKSRKSHMTDTINLLINTGADHNVSCSSPFSGRSLITVAIKAAFTTTNFPTISALLKSGVVPGGEDVGMFDDLAGKYIANHAISSDLECLIRFLSPMIEKSTAHFKLCQAVWSLAIRLGCDFSSDTSIVDTRISLTDDALMTTLFASIRNADFQRLANVVEDPRIKLIDAIDPISGYPPFEVAADAHNLSFEDSLNAFSILLNAGYNVSRPNSRGIWPVHTFAELDNNNEKYNKKYDSICKIFREFVRKGTGCNVLTGQGQNVLHLGCSAPVLIKAFLDLETEENVAAALVMKDEEGYTPISFALAEEEEETALLLLQRANCRPNTLRAQPLFCPSAWKGTASEHSTSWWKQMLSLRLLAPMGQPSCVTSLIECLQVSWIDCCHYTPKLAHFASMAEFL